MTQGVPGEDEMTSRAAGPTDEERAEFKRGELQAVRDLMCNHDLDYDLETLAVHVESFMDPMGTEEPSYLRGKQAGLKLAAALIRDRISSSSATETQDGERRVLDPNQNFDTVSTDDFLGLKWRPDRASIEEIAAGIEEIGTGGTPAFVRGYNRGYDDAYEHAATPTPDDRDREVERIALVLVETTQGGLRYSEPEDFAAALYDAGLRASGGD